MTAPALVAFCSRCQPECEGHAKPEEPAAEAPSEIVDAARWALETVIRSAVAKERECAALSRKLSRLENAIAYAISGMEHRGWQWGATEIMKALNREEG